MNTTSLSPTSADMNAHFAEWRDTNTAILKELKAGCHPREIIAQLSEGLLAHYADKPLIDPVRCLSAPDGFLVRNHAGRLLPDRLRGLEGGDLSCHRDRQERQGKRTRAGPATSYRKLLSSPATSPRSRLPSSNLSLNSVNVTARLSEMAEDHGGEDEAFAELDKVNKDQCRRPALREINKATRMLEGRSCRTEQTGLHFTTSRRPASRSASRKPRSRT